MIAATMVVMGLGAALAARHGQELAERLEGIGWSAVAEQRLPGLALQVTRGDEAMLAAGWGYVDAARATVEGVEVVRDASAALEPLIAIALLRLVEKGELALDDQLSAHVAELAHERRDVRVAQLLAHTSGLASYADCRASGSALGLRRWSHGLQATARRGAGDLFRVQPFEHWRPCWWPSSASSRWPRRARAGDRARRAGMTKRVALRKNSRAALAATPASIWLGVGGLSSTLADLAALPRALAARKLSGSRLAPAERSVLLADGSGVRTRWV